MKLERAVPFLRRAGKAALSAALLAVFSHMLETTFLANGKCQNSTPKT